MSGRGHLTLRGGLLAVGLWAAAATLAVAAYEAGDEVRPFTATDAEGRRHRLADLRGKKHVVLVVWSSRCPHCRAYGERLERLRKAYAERGVVLLGLAPSRGETAEAIAEGKRQAKVEFPVLLDEGGKIARDLGAVTTPTVYLIDKEGRLRYQGAIDDDPQGKKADPEAHLQQAIDAVLAGKDPPKTKVQGPGFRIRY